MEMSMVSPHFMQHCTAVTCFAGVYNAYVTARQHLRIEVAERMRLQRVSAVPRTCRGAAVLTDGGETPWMSR